MLTAKTYDTHLEQLFQRVQQLHDLLTDAGVSYRIVGGLAVFIYVSERDPIRARLTADIDAAVYREHLPAILEAARKAGWTYQYAAGMDMLVEAGQSKARSAVHLVFLDEKVRPEYAEAIPASPPIETHEGIPLATVADLVCMKLTSYRLKDRVHIQDLDAVELIDRSVEAQLTDFLRARLAEIRKSE